jgi:hypothetical protein
MQAAIEYKTQERLKLRNKKEDKRKAQVLAEVTKGKSGMFAMENERKAQGQGAVAKAKADVLTTAVKDAAEYIAPSKLVHEAEKPGALAAIRDPANPWVALDNPRKPDKPPVPPPSHVPPHRRRPQDSHAGVR